MKLYLAVKRKQGIRTYFLVDTLSEIISEGYPLVLRNQAGNDIQIRTTISTGYEDIGIVIDENMDEELDTSNEGLEGTVEDLFKNSVKSVGQMKGEQHNSEIEKRKKCFGDGEWNIMKKTRKILLFNQMKSRKKDKKVNFMPNSHYIK